MDCVQHRDRCLLKHGSNTTKEAPMALKRIGYLLGFLVVWQCAQTGPLYAQVLVQEGKIKEALMPGQKKAGVITIHNTSNEPIDIRSYFEDFKYEEPFRGKKEFLAAGSAQDSCSAWIKFYPQNFSLAPFAKEEINYTISFPDDAQGGYYCVLFFEKSLGTIRPAGNDPADVSQPGVSVVARVGTLFFLESSARKKTIQVDDLRFEQSTLTGSVTNTGDVTLVIKPIYYLISTNGVPSDRGEREKIYLPAGETTKFDVPMSDQLAEGRHDLVITFDLEDGISHVVEGKINRSRQEGFSITNIRQ